MVAGSFCLVAVAAKITVKPFLSTFLVLLWMVFAGWALILHGGFANSIHHLVHVDGL